MKRSKLEIRAKLFRGLGDDSRLRVLEVLRDGPPSAGEIATRAELSQPNASMHLPCLAECGLVRRERQGKFTNYEIADKRVVKLLDHAEDVVLQVEPLIEACRRYRRSSRSGAAPDARRSTQRQR